MSHWKWVHVDDYTKGAEKIARGIALGACESIKDPVAVRYFRQHFMPEDIVQPYWYGKFTPENRMARSLALLFMAEIVKDEEPQR